MRYRFTTVNESVYIIDTDTKTWTRTDHTDKSGVLRSAGDPYRSYVYDGLGYPLRIYGAPLNPFADVREILTSPVMMMEEIR